MGAPASGAEIEEESSFEGLLKFPIKWVPQRVGPFGWQCGGDRSAVSNQVGAPASGASKRPPTWGYSSPVSNQVGAPASGAWNFPTEEILTDGGKFPIKWVPQRVGPSDPGAGVQSVRLFPIKWVPQRVGPPIQCGGIACPFVSNQVGAPASGARESGREIVRVSQFKFPIKWVPQRVGPLGVDRANQFDLVVSNQVGAPASGASPLN